MNKFISLLIIFFAIYLVPTSYALSYTDSTGVRFLIPNNWAIRTLDADKNEGNTLFFNDSVTIFIMTHQKSSSSDARTLFNLTDSQQKLIFRHLEDCQKDTFDSIIPEKTINEKLLVASIPTIKISSTGYIKGILKTQDIYFLIKNGNIIEIFIKIPTNEYEKDKESVNYILNSIFVPRR